MNPDKSIDGKKKKNVICIACNWLRAMVEKVNPTARLAAIKMISASDSTARLPTKGTPNSNLAASNMSETCT